MGGVGAGDTVIRMGECGTSRELCIYIYIYIYVYIYTEYNLPWRLAQKRCRSVLQEVEDTLNEEDRSHLGDLPRGTLMKLQEFSALIMGVLGCTIQEC